MNPQKSEQNKTDGGIEEFVKECLRQARKPLIDASSVVPAYRPIYKEINDLTARIERLITTPL